MAINIDHPCHICINVQSETYDCLSPSERIRTDGVEISCPIQQKSVPMQQINWKMEKAITLREVADYLDRLGVQFMATIGLDGKPKVRPMQYMILEDDRLWFCTNSKKEVYAELQANPWLELCGCKLEKEELQTPWIRFSAQAVFEERQDIRDAIIDKSAIVNALYKDIRQNPIFKVFYLKDIDGWMTNLGSIKGLEQRTGFSAPIHFQF